MRLGAFLSAVFHVLIFLVIFVGLPRQTPEMTDLMRPIPIELITDITQVPDVKKVKEADPEPEPEKPKPIEKEPEVKEEPQPKVIEPKVVPDITPPDEKIEEKSVEKEEEISEIPALAPPEKPKPKPDPKPKKTLPKPVIKQKPKPKVDKKEKKEESFDEILKDLKDRKKTKSKEIDPAADETNKESQDANLGDKLSISEIDAVAQKLAKCWNIPAGARDAENLVVEVELHINPDGVVTDAKIKKDIFLASHPFYEIASERALSAVFDQRCSPLPLPKDKFKLWKEMIFVFNPKVMLGG